MRNGVILVVLLAALKSWSAPVVEGNVSADKLLQWFDAQIKVPANLAVQANNKDKNNGGTGFCIQCSNDNSQPTAQKKTISLYQNTGAVFFQADMDIDCDGTSTGICGGTDPSHQGQLSCDELGKCSKNNGGQVDASTTPFYVTPVGTPFSASSRGVAVGQLAVVINRKTNPISVVYGAMLDEDGVSQEIGEASAGMARLLGVDNNPDTGGQPDGIVYIIFRGPGGRMTSVGDFANHQKAITMGQTLAAALIGSATGVSPSLETRRAASGNYRIDLRTLSVKSEGAHALDILSVDGRSVMSGKAEGALDYDLSRLQPGLYIMKLATANGSFTDKIVRY
jgi:hypothetical protein